MDEFLGKLSGAIDAVAGLVTKYAPDAVEMTLHLVWLKGVVGVAIMAAFLVGFVGSFICLLLCAGKAQETDADREAKNLPTDEMNGWDGLAIAFGVAFIPTFVGFLIKLFSIEMWLAVFDPTSALAYKALVAGGIL